MPFLIDSNVLIDVSRGNAGATKYLDRLGEPCSLSQVTAMELIVGARDAATPAAPSRAVGQTAPSAPATENTKRTHFGDSNPTKQSHFRHPKRTHFHCRAAVLVAGAAAPAALTFSAARENNSA